MFDYIHYSILALLSYKSLVGVDSVASNLVTRLFLLLLKSRLTIIMNVVCDNNVYKDSETMKTSGRSRLTYNMGRRRQKKNPTFNVSSIEINKRLVVAYF